MLQSIICLCIFNFSKIIIFSKSTFSGKLARGFKINVKMDGNALQNGHLNEWIKVRNNSSGKVVEGKIINEKKILINF